MTTLIHPTAVIEKGAEIGSNVSIGAYSVIGANAKIGDNNKIESHVVISGHTTVGESNHFFPFAAIGGPFFRNYFAGGSRSVRGFEARSLGPLDSGIEGINDSADPFGGSKRVILKSALLLPLGPSLDRRFQIFVDGGQVFGPDDSVELDEVRFSAGIGFNWLSPVGPLSLSYAFPLNEEDGDEIEQFQFSVGQLIQ